MPIVVKSNILKGIKMATVRAVTKVVQDYLTKEFGSISVTDTGKFQFPYESTVINVGVLDFGDNQTLVEFDALIALDSKSNADVYEWCNNINFSLNIGTVVHVPAGKNNLTIIKYAIFGDDLDPAELLTSLSLIVVAADGLDDIFVQKFGGKKYSHI